MSNKIPKSSEEKSSGILLDFIFKQINKTYSPVWLWGALVLEIFLIFPLDIIFVIYVMQNKKKVSFLSLSSACCSTISALMGYLIGVFAFNHFSEFIFKFISQITFEKFVLWYQVYKKGIVFLATLLPFPFKIVTVSAGVCKLPLLTFLLTIFVARSLRFTLISLITIQFGDKILRIIERYSYLLLLAVMGLVLLVAYLWLLR